MLMTDLVVPVRLWTAAALGSGGTLTSSGVDVRRWKRLDSLIFDLAVGAGNADIKIEYATSQDGTTWSGNTTVVASTLASYASTPNGENVVPLDAPLAPFVRFKLTELATKATTVTMALYGRE